MLQAICAQAWCRYADLAGIGLVGTKEAMGLTKREIEILKWIKHGKNNSEISEIMTVSIKTVDITSATFSGSSAHPTGRPPS